MTAQDLKALRLALDRLGERPFPNDSVASEQLSDVHADLAEYDGHIAGIATSILAGAHVDRHLLESHHSWRAPLAGLLGELDPSARALAQEYLEYYLLLEEVLEHARRVAERRASS